jgi:hypothetical protein
MSPRGRCNSIVKRLVRSTSVPIAELHTVPQGIRYARPVRKQAVSSRRSAPRP